MVLFCEALVFGMAAKTVEGLVGNERKRSMERPPRNLQRNLRRPNGEGVETRRKSTTSLHPWTCGAGFHFT